MLPNKFILDFPELRQVYNYDCGASALQSVLTYYGYEEREDTLMAKLGTVSTDIENNGTDIKAIVTIAKKYDVEAEVDYDIDILTLKGIVKRGMPVIVLLQAYNEDKSHDYRNTYTDGHYVVCIGWSNDRLIFEDPSSYYRTSLTEDELMERWHALDDNNNKDKRSVSIIFDGTPNFKSNKIIKMQ